MKSDKFDKAVQRVSATDVVVTDTKATIDDVMQPIDWQEFAQAVRDGGQMGVQFVSMKENDQFRAFYMDRKPGQIEQIEDGKAVLRNVHRLVFELATKDRVGTGVMFSLLEVTQLQQQLSDSYPADGSVFVLVGKAGKKKTNRKRDMDVYNVIAFPGVRKPRRGGMILDEATGLPLLNSGDES